MNCLQYKLYNKTLYVNNSFCLNKIGFNTKQVVYVFNPIESTATYFLDKTICLIKLHAVSIEKN